MSGVELLKLNLQLFAEGGEGGSGAQGGGNGAGEGDEGQAPISFANQSEFDSVVDKRISKALETAQSKWQTESDKRVAEAKSEGEKLAKLNEDQRAELEKQQQDEALAQREADITRRELRAQFCSILENIRELTEVTVEVGIATYDADYHYDNISPEKVGSARVGYAKLIHYKPTVYEYVSIGRHKGDIYGMFIHEDYQGKGLGKLLLSTLINKVKRISGFRTNKAVSCFK